MSDGWNESANAWIASIGEQGDWGRQHVIDPALSKWLHGRSFARALDVGCGEGRICRLLQANGIETVGVDPTQRLLEEARKSDPNGDYKDGRAEELPFKDDEFDLVVTCLSLIDIPDFRKGISEMARVLKAGGTLLSINLNSFVTASAYDGWARDESGALLHYRLDHYMDAKPQWVEWSGIRVVNWHRPISAYMHEFLGNGLQLRRYDELVPASAGDEMSQKYRRVPWFHLMEWQRPLADK
ncbi:MAG: class I SAM-dependent methyltransferase [Hyphomicrobiales bacterium]|nr:class I SAM-dependent methyltransferase [Hyphomicrobiales bacterium]